MGASVYTVGQVNSYIKNMFNEDFALNNIGIKGEVSNCKYHSSGHIYFSLKDKTGVIACVMFAGNRKGLNFSMKEGQKIIVFGTIGVYERDGKYQMYAKEITLDGMGDLYQKYEELKKNLEEMGMFSDIYKKPVPRYAGKIGIVTAETGAAIQDIINISKRRNPYVKLYLYPAIVQGQEAKYSIVNGINCLDSMNLDVIIVGRGGGSIEDLWAFNEEIVARAIFECNTPVISAVGHETDTTIADWVADMRAPTPSAAAELAVFEYEAFLRELAALNEALSGKIRRRIEDKYNKLEYNEVRLKNLSPSNVIMAKATRAMELEDRLSIAMQQIVRDKKYKLSLLSGRMEGVSPLNKISKGYAYVSDDNDKALTTVKSVSEGDTLHIHLSDGIVKAKVADTTERKLKYGGKK